MLSTQEASLKEYAQRKWRQVLKLYLKADP